MDVVSNILERERNRIIFDWEKTNNIILPNDGLIIRVSMRIKLYAKDIIILQKVGIYTAKQFTFIIYNI